MDSILTSIKKLSGVSATCPHFDDQIVAYINSVFLVLRQLGVGPEAGFVITDESEIWSDFLPNDPVMREATKSYMSAKVRIQFDPPSSSAHMEALKSTISEYEWRLNVEAETTSSTDVPSEPTDPSTPVVGTTDYRQLSNLPKINGETLIDNYNEKDPTVVEMSEDEVENMWNEEFDET